MSKQIENFLNQAASMMGLRRDSQVCLIYGTRMEYDLMMFLSESNANEMTLMVSVEKNNSEPIAKELQAFVKSTKLIRNVTVNRNRVEFQTTVSANKMKNLEPLHEVVDIILRYLYTQGYRNCCQICGTSEQVSPSVVCGTPVFLCDNCYNQQGQLNEMQKAEKARKKENILGGIVGALLGSLIGVAAIVLFSQMGYVAAISGVIMAVCTLKGYELLGGKLNTRGIVICSVLMLLMPYLGDRADWAIVIARELDVDVFTGFRMFGYLMSEGFIEVGSYYFNIVLLYVFTIVGAVSIVLTTLKNMEVKNVTYHLRGYEQGNGSN